MIQRGKSSTATSASSKNVQEQLEARAEMYSETKNQELATHRKKRR